MDETYSLWTGLIYVFNLIVGTGALTLPAAVSRAGWALGVAMLMTLAFVSFITVTFVVEAMATSIAIGQWKRLKQLKIVSQNLCMVINQDVDDEENESAEDTPLNPSDDGENMLLLPPQPPVDDNFDSSLTDSEMGHPRCSSLPPTLQNAVMEVSGRKVASENMVSCMHPPHNLAAARGVLLNFPSTPVSFYSIDQKIELGQMAKLYFPRIGQVLFYSCFCLYLFGDLAIYSAAVSKSLVEVVCSADRSSSFLKANEACFTNSSITQQTAYKLFLGAFLLIFGPFVFFNVQKTKYLQILTSITRWLAFSVMIMLAVRRLLSPTEQHGSPVVAKLSGIPELFGSCIYSFMCHHSLPGLLSPITNKRNLRKALAADYALILTFYLTLVLTGIFAFPTIHDLYTLNFTPKPNDPSFLKLIDYFLTLFPVFTLSTSFPVIAVTLRSNLQALLPPTTSYCTMHILVPAFGVITPVLIAMNVKDVEVLVGFTGSYAGAGIQYLIPAFLVMSARAAVPPELGQIENSFASPFRSGIWPILVIIWSIICIGFVSLNLGRSFFSH